MLVLRTSGGLLTMKKNQIAERGGQALTAFALASLTTPGAR